MSNKGTIKVLDSSEKRLSRVLADASAARVSIVRTHLVEDFTTISNVFSDTVMLHVPSSRTGVFWREPSIKWRTQPGFIKYFESVQEGLLDIWSEALDVGGNLVYWTTSIALEEDELVIERFMARHPEFVLAETFPKIGVPGLRGQSQSQRLFPHLHLCDGAFVARLEKVKNT
jgi:16S rRNA (cytosine967-C5)-methyltransferase